MKKFWLLIIFLAFGLPILSIANAQIVTDLSISPPSVEINAKPGEKTRTQIKFFNRSLEPVSGFIKKADFIVSDKDGTPNLIDTSSVNNRYAASKWLTTSLDRVTIAANSPYTTDVFIDVPTNVSSCGHYAAVYFQPSLPEMGNKKTGSPISFKLASLISINVAAGQCKEKAHVSKFQTPLFLEYGPIPVSFEILNRSDYHISPQGYLNISNVFDHPTDYKTLDKNNIFPDAIRRYNVNLGSKWMFGRYKISFSAGYGKTGQSLTSATYTWVFPWRIFLVIVLTIALIIFVINSLFKRLSTKESILEGEIEKEKQEIEKLKQELRKKRD